MAQQHGEKWHCQRLGHSTHQVQTALRPQDPNIGLPIQRHIHRRQDEIQRVGRLPQSLGITRIDDVISAEASWLQSSFSGLLEKAVTSQPQA